MSFNIPQKRGNLIYFLLLTLFIRIVLGDFPYYPGQCDKATTSNLCSKYCCNWCVDSNEKGRCMNTSELASNNTCMYTIKGETSGCIAIFVIEVISIVIGVTFIITLSLILLRKYIHREKQVYVRFN